MKIKFNLGKNTVIGKVLGKCDYNANLFAVQLERINGRFANKKQKESKLAIHFKVARVA